MTDEGKKSNDFNAQVDAAGPFTPVEMRPAPVPTPLPTPTLPTPTLPTPTLPAEGCHTCRHHSARKRPRVTDTAGYDAYVEFADDDETVYTCRRYPDYKNLGGEKAPVGFEGERLVPLRAGTGPDECALYEAGSKGRKTSGAERAAEDEALKRAQARWSGRGDGGHGGREEERVEQRTGEFFPFAKR